MIKIGAIIIAFFLSYIQTKDLENKFFQNYTQDQLVLMPSLKQFKQLKKDFEYTLVYYQSSHCKICQNFEKKYFKLAQNLYSIEPELPIVKLNCTQKNLKDFCSYKERIKHFPTIRIYHHNQYTKYKGRFNLKEVQNWVLERTIHSIQQLDQVKLKLFQNILELEELIVLAFIKDDDIQNKKQFSLVSTLFGMAHFYQTNDKEIYENSLKICQNLKNEIHGENSNLVLIHPDHHKCYFYNEIFDHQKILKFLNDKEKAALRPFDQESIKMHNYYKIPIVILFINDINQQLFKEYEKIADFYHDQFFFTYIDENIYQGKYPKFNLKNQQQKFEQKNVHDINLVISLLGTQKNNWPELYVFRQKNEHFQDKWKFNLNFTSNNMIEFLAKVHDKKEPQYTKTEDQNQIEIYNKNNQIKKLSSKNFKQMTQQNCIVFLEGGREMCKNCEQDFEEFTKALKILNINKEFPIKIYRFNVQYNELKDWNFERVPEILFINSQNKIETYDKIMKAKNINQFLKKTLEKENIIFRSNEF